MMKIYLEVEILFHGYHHENKIIFKNFGNHYGFQKSIVRLIFVDFQIGFVNLKIKSQILNKFVQNNFKLNNGEFK